MTLDPVAPLPAAAAHSQPTAAAAHDTQTLPQSTSPSYDLGSASAAPPHPLAHREAAAPRRYSLLGLQGCSSYSHRPAVAVAVVQFESAAELQLGNP